MAVPEPRVREELLGELHRANERLHASKQEWEKWTASSEYRHQERVDEAMNKVREAEREVERVEERIAEVMGERKEF